MIIQGRALRMGDDIDTDIIIPGRYLTTTDAEKLARHCFEDLGPPYKDRLGPESVIVAGKNFGCGSSREHAAVALKATGVRAIIAVSFARIFFRNAISLGLPTVQASIEVPDGAGLEIDFDKGVIRDENGAILGDFPPYPPSVKQIVEAGGLVNYVKQRLGR